MAIQIVSNTLVCLILLGAGCSDSNNIADQGLEEDRSKVRPPDLWEDKVAPFSVLWVDD